MWSNNQEDPVMCPVGSFLSFSDLVDYVSKLYAESFASTDFLSLIDTD